jgi:glutamate synthase (NADPH/NADH) large chain
VRDPHHFAVLFGLGATAIYPYLAYQTIEELIAKSQSAIDNDNQVMSDAIAQYRNAIDSGLRKIMSKMGISTLASYRGAQLFEALGLGNDIIRRCFPGMPSRIGGVTFDWLEQEYRAQHQRALVPHLKIPQGGLLKYQYGAEQHAYNPDVVQSLQRAVNTGRYSDYQHFATLVNHRQPMALRDLLQLKAAPEPTPINRVEAAEQLFHRFDSAAMSIGALSPEAHEALAVAMNRLGGRSNSGEGGEDPLRFQSLKNSKIKQIASGRFGVDA